MNEERRWYVYKITNSINGKIYIGKTENIRIRWNAHKTAARNKIPGDYAHLHRAMNKYGLDNFTIEKIAEYENEQECLDAETNYIKLYNARDRSVGYNLTDGGDGSSGYRHTEESKQLMSKIKKEQFLGEGNPFYGKTHTEETRALISKLMTERQDNAKEKYDAMNIAQCDFSKDECLIIQRRFLHDNQTFEQLAETYDTGLKTIHNIIHGTYKAIQGHSILSNDDIERIKAERNVVAHLALQVFSLEQEKQLVTDRLSGLSLKELSIKYGAHHNTIAKYLRRNGLKGRIAKPQILK